VNRCKDEGGARNASGRTSTSTAVRGAGTLRERARDHHQRGEWDRIVAFDGSFHVWEAFSEALVPLYDIPHRGTQVDLNLAARFANYSRAGGIWTWKAGLDLQATNDLRLRTTYSRDAREGTFAEMFDQQAGAGSVTDPLFDDAEFSISVTDAGNPEIGPEIDLDAFDHHKAEAVFKALARALDDATLLDARIAGQVPSTKGTL
jgi:outer membrane receptor protein involved in Fe transport